MSICNERQSISYNKNDNFNFYPKKHITLAITLCYDFALSHTAFILSRIVITKETYLKIKGKVFANG